MRKVFFDTGILNKIAWGKEEASVICSRWNLFLDQMNDVYPGFSEEDFMWITSSALLLEIIGFGKIRKSNNRSLKNLVIKDEWKKYVLESESFVKDIANRIDNFIRDKLSPRILYRQTISFVRNYPAHDNSHFIIGHLKHWAKNIKKDVEEYNYFRENILWDSIFRYPFIDIKNIARNDREQAMMIWAEVRGILFREYYAEYIINYQLECSVLGLFADIHTTGSFYNAPTNRSDCILRTWDDMVDADSIHFALMGKRISLNVNEPVLVVTIDKKEDVEQRLECLYKNLEEIQHKKINICPGTIIFFSPQTMLFDGKLDVQDFINQFSISESKIAEL